MTTQHIEIDLDDEQIRGLIHVVEDGMYTILKTSFPFETHLGLSTEAKGKIREASETLLIKLRNAKRNIRDSN